MLLLLGASTVANADESYFNISRSEYAVFVTVDQAKRSAESQIWKEAYELCEGHPIPILLVPIKFKTVGYDGSLEVIGNGKYNCGF